MASLGEPSHSKRPHIITEKMMEFRKAQGDISPHKQRSCPIEGCNKVLTSAPGLRYHIQTHHMDMKEFTCPGCKKIFKSSNGLKYHLNKHKCSVGASANQHSDIQPGDGTIPGEDNSVMSPGHPSPDSAQEILEVGQNGSNSVQHYAGSAIAAQLNYNALATQMNSGCMSTQLNNSPREPALCHYDGGTSNGPQQSGAKNSSKMHTKQLELPNKRFIPPPLMLFPSSVKQILDQPLSREVTPVSHLTTEHIINRQQIKSASQTAVGDERMLAIGDRAGDSRLIEFAKIATSPQSPLMQVPKKPWEQTRSVIRKINMDNDLPNSHQPCNESLMDTDGSVGNHSDDNSQVTAPVKDTNGNYCNDGSDSRVTSSSPIPSSPAGTQEMSGTWSHNWPNAVWQCFIKDVKVSFLSEDGRTHQPWQCVEDLARRDALALRAVRQENIHSQSYAPNGIRIKQINSYKEVDNIPESAIHILFTPDVIHQPDLVASCSQDHPFFVKDKGWSSYNPNQSATHYGIPCCELSKNDVCLPPNHPDATFSNDVFQSYAFTPQDSSAVFTLSNMAKHKRDIEHTCTSPTKKRSTKAADPLKAKRPMNAFMLFARENRLSLTQNFPGKDNRTISVMLGDKWKKMTTKEKSVYEGKAKELAEEQKKIHPDCWKRKK